jgi:hypothetical protein
MQEEFKNPENFEFHLNTFLASGRSVTDLFEKEFSFNKRLMEFHKNRMKEWHENKVTRLLYELRNVSLKEQSPPTRKTIAVSYGVDVIISDKYKVIKTSPDGTQESKGYEERPPEDEVTIVAKSSEPLKTDEIVAYAFEDVPKWFDLDRDVIEICKQYLTELTKYVDEAERLLGSMAQ